MVAVAGSVRQLSEHSAKFRNFGCACSPHLQLLRTPPWIEQSPVLICRSCAHNERSLLKCQPAPPQLLSRETAPCGGSFFIDRLVRGGICLLHSFETALSGGCVSSRHARIDPEHFRSFAFWLRHARLDCGKLPDLYV